MGASYMGTASRLSVIYSRRQATDICLCRVFYGGRSRQSSQPIPPASLPLVSTTVTHEALCSFNYSSYTGTDPIGIELSGALKNVYAIAAGMSDGLGFKNNTRASEYRAHFLLPTQTEYSSDHHSWSF